jgi:hypothetical protein
MTASTSASVLGDILKSVVDPDHWYRTTMLGFRLSNPEGEDVQQHDRRGVEPEVSNQQ